MCDPVTIGLTLATSAASAYLQNRAAGAVDKARAGVQQRFDQDIDKIRDTSRVEYQKSVDASRPETIQQAMVDATADRTADYQAALAEPEIIDVAANGSEASKKAFTKALAKSKQRSQDMAARRAAAEAYGIAAGNRDVVKNRTSIALGQQADFARDRAGVAEVQFQDANNAGSKYANLAGLVDAVGALAPAAAGYGVDAGWWGGKSPTTGITWNSAPKIDKTGLIRGPVGYYSPP